MNYRVDAIFKDRAGKELLRRTPIWTGEADDAKSAVVQAHEPVTAVCKTDERIDSISLTVKGQDGSVIHTTEYAEDFTIGYGASALDGSGLAARAVAQLTDEQREEALKHLKARAVAALPGSAQEKLRQRALEEAVRARSAAHRRRSPFRRGGTVADSSTSGAESGAGGDLASPGPGCDKTFADADRRLRPRRSGEPRLRQGVHRRP